MKTIFKAFLMLLIFGLVLLAARAQDEVPPPMPGYQSLADAQLDQLLGPIALYPDPLISTLLPASTFPTEIVMADRYLTSGGDPNAIDQQPWDPSVQALAHYPQVLSWMDNNLNWTTQVGQAFQNQQQDVMDSIQRLRMEAYNLGNLQSSPQQQVVDDSGDIEILPANPDDVYVPEYQPDQVYYDQPYGNPFITFSVGYAIGPWLCCDFDWHDHHLFFWNRDNPVPNGWWHNRPDWHGSDVARHTTVWNPGARPAGSVFQGDRGWNNSDNRGRTAPQARPATPAPEVRNIPTPPQQHSQMNDQRPQENPWQNNAFIGGDNARDVRADSQRGGESVRTITPPAPHESSGGGSFHAAPSSGGGSFHGSTGGGGGGGGGGRR